ncbi:MAG: response regulator [Spirochaetaceae bacterium]|nr:response regulator [Spirochaetaceae bacterium]
MKAKSDYLQNKFDTLLSKLPTDFINLSSLDLKNTIHNWMVEIAFTLEAEISVLFSKEPGKKLFICDFWRKETHTDPVLYNPAELFPYLTSEILKGNTVIASSYKDLPKEAKIDKLNLQKMGTTSFIFFPMSADKQILGSFLFGYKTKAVSWDKEFVKKLGFIIQIFTLLIKNEEDKKLLQERLRYEHLLSNLSRDFVTIELDEIPDKITYWLHEAAKTLGSDRALVFKLDAYNKFYMSTTWKSVDGKEVISYDPEELFPWMSTELRSGKAVIIPELSAFPKEASTDRINMDVIGSISVLVLPLMVNNKILGALAFSGTTPNFQITPILVQRFQIISQTFATALQRQKTELKLAEEKERLAVTLKSIGDGVITTDEKGNITLLNDVAEKLTAWSLEEALDKPVNQVFTIINERTGETQESPVEKVLKTLKIVTLLNHTLLIDKNGNKIPIADSGAPIKDSSGNILGVILVFRDVALEKQREEDILKLKKLESIGILAGGIAHDFNNILTGILGNINLVSLKTSTSEEKNRYLSNASKACKRAASLTQKLLTFSKGGAPVKENASLGEIITESMDFILHGSQIKTEFSIPDNLWSSEVDRDQINQVIQNLAINSMESMVNGGKLTVDCKNKIFSQNHPRHGKYIEIKIKDTGSGISNENLDKIFDPYFSTKETGSGLGLAVTHSIIHKHDGFIDVQSQPGKGTVFFLYLPASENELPISKTQIPENQSITKNSYTILVMDDEEMIRTMLTTLLTKLGHKVSTSCDGAETIEKYKNSSFDFVILDITIPGGIGGIETIKQLKQINPDIKAIVSSGYANSPVISNYYDYGFCASLTKPYLLDELKTVIEKVMIP